MKTKWIPRKDISDGQDVRIIAHDAESVSEVGEFLKVVADSIDERDVQFIYETADGKHAIAEIGEDVQSMFVDAPDFTDFLAHYDIDPSAGTVAISTEEIAQIKHVFTETYTLFDDDLPPAIPDDIV